MNTLKFLAIKIAEQAAEIANGAEHVADSHTDVSGPVEQEDISACQEELLTDILELAALAVVAQQNSLVPTATRELVDEIKLETRRALMREAFMDMARGELVGDLAI